MKDGVRHLHGEAIFNFLGCGDQWVAFMEEVNSVKMIIKETRHPSSMNNINPIEELLYGNDTVDASESDVNDFVVRPVSIQTIRLFC